MRKHFIVIAALAITHWANAAPVDCKPSDQVMSLIKGAVPDWDLSKCQCPTRGRKSKSEFERHFKLLAICGPDQSTGVLFFDGTKTYSGNVRREETVTFGDIITFEGFTFANQKAAIRAFHPPKLKGEVNCWRAKATVEVKMFWDIPPDGSDFSGTFLHSYEVISIGKYTRCKGETDAF